MSSLFFGALDRGTEKKVIKDRILFTGTSTSTSRWTTDIPVAENPKNQNNNNKHSLRTNANAAAGCWPNKRKINQRLRNDCNKVNGW